MTLPMPFKCILRNLTDGDVKIMKSSKFTVESIILRIADTDSGPQLLPMSFKCVLRNPTDVGLGGLGVTCSPRDPRFAGSNPTEVDGLFQDVKILSISPPGGTLSRVRSLRFQAC